MRRENAEAESEEVPPTKWRRPEGWDANRVGLVDDGRGRTGERTELVGGWDGWRVGEVRLVGRLKRWGGRGSGR